MGVNIYILGGGPLDEFQGLGIGRGDRLGRAFRRRFGLRAFGKRVHCSDSGVFCASSKQSETLKDKCRS